MTDLLSFLSSCASFPLTLYLPFQEISHVLVFQWHCKFVPVVSTAFNSSSASLLLFLPSIASVELTKSGKDTTEWDVVNKFHTSFPKWNYLRKLYLQKCKLTEIKTGISLLVWNPAKRSDGGFSNLNHLEKLDLDTCELQDIGTILIQLNSLEELDLSENSNGFSNGFSTEINKFNCTLTRCEHVIPFLELTLHQKKEEGICVVVDIRRDTPLRKTLAFSFWVFSLAISFGLCPQRLTPQNKHVRGSRTTPRNPAAQQAQPSEKLQSTIFADLYLDVFYWSLIYGRRDLRVSMGHGRLSSVYSRRIFLLFF